MERKDMEMYRKEKKRKRNRSTKKYKEITDSNSPTGPNETVRLATLLL